MMRLLFLCVLLLLPAATALSEDEEGSADDPDDEDIHSVKNVSYRGVFQPEIARPEESSKVGDKSPEESSNLSLIVIAVVVTMVALSVIAVAAVILVKQQKLKRQQGIYSVPTEQNQKETI